MRQPLRRADLLAGIGAACAGIGAACAGIGATCAGIGVTCALAEADDDVEDTIPRNASLRTVLAARRWLNGTPSDETLRGKVVIVDVFTFACANCQNITPNLRALWRKRAAGLEIVGIHSPETPFERDHHQVVRYLARLGVTWPVAIDDDFALWKAYRVEYWPTQMVFDRRGALRDVVIGDSQDAQLNAIVAALLRERAEDAATSSPYDALGRRGAVRRAAGSRASVGGSSPKA